MQNCACAAFLYHRLCVHIYTIIHILIYDYVHTCICKSANMRRKNVHLRDLQKIICASANMRLCAQKRQGRDACLEYVHKVDYIDLFVNIALFGCGFFLQILLERTIICVKHFFFQYLSSLRISGVDDVAIFAVGDLFGRHCHKQALFAIYEFYVVDCNAIVNNHRGYAFQFATVDFYKSNPYVRDVDHAKILLIVREIPTIIIPRKEGTIKIDVMPCADNHTAVSKHSGTRGI